MIDKLLLETKSDIFISAINEFIHQPSIQEIAYHAQGEKKFFEVLDIICKTIVDIDLLKQENSLTSEQIKLFESISSFDYLIGLIAKDVHIFIYLKLLFKIFFPEHECELTDKTDNSGNIVMIIKMTPIPESPHRKPFVIDPKNYDDIIAYIKEICCLTNNRKQTETQEFNPVNDLAKKIADKIKQSRKIIEETKQKQGQNDYLFARIVDLLRGSGQFSQDELNSMTIYLLNTTYKRFNLYEAKNNQIVYHANGFEIKEFIDWAQDLTQGKK